MKIVIFSNPRISKGLKEIISSSWKSLPSRDPIYPPIIITLMSVWMTESGKYLYICESF